MCPNTCIPSSLYTCAEDDDETEPPPFISLGNDSYSIVVKEESSELMVPIVSSDSRRCWILIFGGVMRQHIIRLLSVCLCGRSVDEGGEEEKDDDDDELTDAANASTVLGDGCGC